MNSINFINSDYVVSHNRPGFGSSFAFHESGRFECGSQPGPYKNIGGLVIFWFDRISFDDLSSLLSYIIDDRRQQAATEAFSAICFVDKKAGYRPHGFIVNFF